MQSTLLTIGIAIIFALLAALIGPLFIDWEGYRSTVEAEASRVFGATVNVTGPIEVRLLPTPSAKLAGVELRGTESRQPVTVQQIAMEFSLAHLLRGEIHANEVAIEGAELSAALDGDGHVRVPLAQLGFSPDRLAIDRLAVENGRVRLDDTASGNSIVLEHVTFNGEVRSLAGPFKAEGSFVAAGEQFAFRLAAGHLGDDGAMKLRLGIDPEERAVTLETEGTLRVDEGRPSFEGDMTLSRVVGKATGGGRPTYKEPWKLTGKVKATAASARVAQFDLQYGPDVRAIHGTGSAEMHFGRDPRIATTLSVRQIDVDRVFGNPGGKQLPLEMAKALLDDSRASSALPDVPIHLDVALDNVTLAGATLTSVHANVEHTPIGWNVAALDLRAPGATTLHAVGKVATTGGQLGFSGPVKINSSDPSLLFGWLEGQSGAGRVPLGRMSGSGTVALGSERVAVEELRAEIDGKTLQGKLSYRFASDTAPARIEAALAASEIDFNRAIALGNAVFGPTNFTRPGEVKLALDLGHASYSGIEAKNARAVLAFDSSGLKIDQLSIANVGDAAIVASGHVETIGDAARGSIKMSVATPRLAPLVTLADTFFPDAVDPLRRLGERVSDVSLSGTLDFEPRPANGVGTQTATLKLSGKVAGNGVTLKANATGELGSLSKAALRVEGRLDGPQAGPLAAMLGLDTLVNADARPASTTLFAEGHADSGFRVEGHFAGSNVDASASGNLSVMGAGTLDVTLRAADARLPRRGPGALVPVDLRAHVEIGGETVNLIGLSGKIAGSDVKGQLLLGLDPPLQVNGRIEADQLDGAALIGLLTGAPANSAASTWWSAEPFGQPSVPAMEGAVEFRVGNVSWPGILVARTFAGTLHLKPSGFSLTGVTGKVADGQLSLDAQVRRDAGGVSLGSHVELSKADMPALFASALRVPASGRVTIAADLQGQGMSPASLMGALTGAGTIEAERFEIAGLDPNAIDATIGALERDHALASNPSRLAQFAGTALDAGRLKLAGAIASFTISSGRAQLIRFATPTPNFDIGGSISVGLTDGQIDMRLEMKGPQRQNALSGERPQMTVALKGPLGAPRRSADVGPLVNWVTMQRVEQEARHLEEAEKTRSRIEDAIEALRR